MTDHLFRGLNAENPLGFLAALGVLRALDDHARRSALQAPRLSFVDVGYPAASVRSTLGRDEVTTALLEDAALVADDPILRLAYDSEGNGSAPDMKEVFRDLKPSPALARQALLEAAEHSRRSADLAAAVFSDLVQDNNGNTKPTALHFTAGQQQFLEMLDELRSGLSPYFLSEALDGPWKEAFDLPSLSWDSTAARQYALRAVNPSSQKRGTVAGANWLAAVGLTLLPVVARNDVLRTTGVRGGWKDGSFTWPIWDAPATCPTVRAHLALDWMNATRAERSALGVTGVLRSRIIRSDQGGYGSFSPAETLLPGGGTPRSTTAPRSPAKPRSSPPKQGSFDPPSPTAPPPPSPSR